ncbi:hypothetical protein LR48_Vigan07g146900 [Vigna angularis]|uniref:Uncharacterized protein n=1 Tax=Phaseolus angularis TaxID=3914 RepID=A0A0L9UY17_PHAAN|nr:hypothetical protein LR48_Vigan07g146900 [Vigna angularis]
MTGDCYVDLVQVFYHNLKVVDGVICSWVKGVDIKIDDKIWISFTGLKAEGFMSHERNFELNQWTNKKKIYKEYLRSPTRLKDVDKTPSTFTPQTEFERYVVDQFRRLSTRISKVQKSLIMIRKKLDEDTALITPSASESDDEDDTPEDEIVETSDSY